MEKITFDTKYSRRISMRESGWCNKEIIMSVSELDSSDEVVRDIHTCLVRGDAIKLRDGLNLLLNEPPASVPVPVAGPIFPQAGSDVVCVEPGPHPSLTQGAVYKVVRSYDGFGGDLDLADDDGDVLMFAAQRFEAVSPTIADAIRNAPTPAAETAPSVTVGEGIGDIYAPNIDPENVALVANSLRKAFVWGSSPEGHAFWFAIYGRLHSIADILRANAKKAAEEAAAVAQLTAAREASVRDGYATFPCLTGDGDALAITRYKDGEYGFDTHSDTGRDSSLILLKPDLVDELIARLSGMRAHDVAQPAMVAF
jgi:hypothetical protein